METSPQGKLHSQTRKEGLISLKGEKRIEPHKQTSRCAMDFIRDGAALVGAGTQMVDPWLARWGLLIWSLAVVVLGIPDFVRLGAGSHHLDGRNLSTSRDNQREPHREL